MPGDPNAGHPRARSATASVEHFVRRSDHQSRLLEVDSWLETAGVSELGREAEHDARPAAASLPGGLNTIRSWYLSDRRAGVPT
jgi:hypothetical protein